jgi:mRNA interferase MazF
MKGKIVVLPFPFTDLTSYKRRPALVLHEYKSDVVVAYISSVLPSNPSPTDVLVPRTSTSFKRTGLITESVILQSGG